ncbi:MAG: hypothetical protein AABZ31_04495 [Bdellovibrionota bacterium]
MSNAMKYIKNLEAAGFERNQAEAQVQMVLDAIEGDLVTKADFAVFKEQIENRFSNFEQSYENKFSIFESRIDKKILESEFRTTSRLGVLFVSSLSVAVAVLAWIIKI